MLLSKGSGWKNWRQQVKKALVAMAVVTALVVVCQTWLAPGSTASLWLPAVFVSESASSALKAQLSPVKELSKLIASPGTVISDQNYSVLGPAPSASELWMFQQQSNDQGTKVFRSPHSDEITNDKIDDTNKNFPAKSPSPTLIDFVVKEDHVVKLNSGTREHCCSASKRTGEDEIKLNPSLRSAFSPETRVDISPLNDIDHDNVIDTNATEHSLAGNEKAASNFDSTDRGLDRISPSQLFPPRPVVGVGDSAVSAENPWRPLLKPQQELYSARKAIAYDPLNNSSMYSDLYAPLYQNLSQFKKSYELMEEKFRVFVYKEGRKPLVHTGPIAGIYSSEGLFIHAMEQNQQFVVKNPDEAHAFFLPYSVTTMVRDLYVPNSRSMLPLATFIKQYVELIAARHPFWNRTEGKDHFFVSCHDWGPATARDHEELRRNAIKVVCNADVNEEFVKARDVSLLEFYSHWKTLTDVKRRSGQNGREPPGPEARAATLAFFAGQMHGRVRPELLRHWRWPKGGDEMQIYEVLPAALARRSSYEQRMKASKYCICAMGFEVNSPRIVESIFAGCVPVIIADGFVLPFADVLDWSAFSVTVAEVDIPSLKSILEAVPERRYRSMQRRLRVIRRHFTWHFPPVPFDAFHMILHSVWTSRLRNAI